MTRGEMKEAIRYSLGMREPEEQSEIEKQIHLGICDLLRRTSCYVQCIDADLPDGMTRFELGPSIGKVIYLYRGNVLYNRVVPAALPSYGTGPVFAQISQMLLFNQAFQAGEQAQLYAVPRPPAMTDDADAIEDEQWGGIPPEFQDGVELYACAKLGSRSDDSTSGMGGAYWQTYVGQDGRGGRAAEIRRMVNRQTGQTLGQATLEYRLPV